jgi:hypothetical protein
MMKGGERISTAKKEGTTREDRTEERHKKAYKEYLEIICEEIMKLKKKR